MKSIEVRGVAFLIAALLAVPAMALGGCEDIPVNAMGLPAGPASHIYRICLPAAPNGAMVVYAHGYVKPDPAIPVAIPESQMSIDGVSVADLVTSMGFVFATTSYPKTGLAVKEGIEDVKHLVDFVKFIAPTKGYPAPARVYLAGVSEGGLVTAKAIEKYGNESFDGGLALCGPTGDFRKQVNHYGDFRVVFDYLFPGVLPGSAVDIPDEVMNNWDTLYVPNIKWGLAANPVKMAKLLSVTGVQVDPADPAQTVVDLLWYNIFATNDAREELGGQPFDNKPRLYLGSGEDLKLNLRVKRFDADAAALSEIQAHYQTTGKLPVPLVTMHTTGDPIVPYSQATIYRLKTLAGGSLLKHLHLPVVRQGHCSFSQGEVLMGFYLMLAMSGN
ncbi:MAG: hypothetical protein IH602_02990 [Bryobacteraceae bacterium]|nr:hypothetical protein [Bryobacteraceae bacterium]